FYTSDRASSSDSRVEPAAIVPSVPARTPRSARLLRRGARDMSEGRLDPSPHDVLVLEERSRHRHPALHGATGHRLEVGGAALLRRRDRLVVEAEDETVLVQAREH